MSGEYQKYRPFPKHSAKASDEFNKYTDKRLNEYAAIGKTEGDNSANDTLSTPGKTIYHSSAGVKPNVVRIEVLSPAARRRYLNGGLAYNGTTSFQAEADMCKQLMTDVFTEGDCWKPFYGITDQTTDAISLSFESVWQANKGATGGINSFVGKAVSTTANVAGSAASKMGPGLSALASIPESKLLSILGGIGGAALTGSGKAISAVLKNITKLPDIIEAGVDSVGADYKMSGACTLKEFVGSSFKPAKQITCKWYMPEQEKLARISIGRLIRMSYSRGLRTNLDSEEYRKMFKFIAGAGIANITDPVVGNIAAATNDGKFKVDDVIHGIAEAGGELADGLQWLIQQIGNAGGAVLPAVLNAFGNTMTIDPLPVRLTVGHILDVEPLVITGVSLVCSKEQYVSPDGSHLPLFVTAKVDFDMWMTPNPNTGFIQFMGDPLFKQEDDT